MKPNFTYKYFLVLIAVLFFAIQGFSQSTGDYRSVATGNWTSLSSWQYFDGTTWVTPSGTSPQGYPGQYSGTGAVLIQAGNTISIGSAGITTQVFGVLTINGTLVLNGINTGGTGTNYNINTSGLIVTSGLTPAATVNFQNKVNLKLPASTPVNVKSGGLSGDCSNNQDIYIGSSVISYCQGGGGTPTFQEVMNNGGYYVLNVSPESDSSCGSKTFSFTATAFPTSGSTIKWYTTPTGGTAFRTSTSGTDTYTPTLSTTTTYYVEVAYGSYTTARKAITATVVNTAAPTGTASQSFCSGATVSNLSATGSGIKWYSASTGGSALASTTALTNGTHYYASQTVSGCESTSRLDVTVSVNSYSVAPTSITGTTTICNGTSTTLTLNGGSAGTGATAKWYSGSCGGTLVGTGSSISVSPTLTTTYFVRYEGICNTTSCVSTTVTVNPLPDAAGIISGTTSLCKGVSSIVYSVPVITNATSYSWTYTGTGATISGTTHSITIDFATNATSGNLTVYGVNSCGNGTVSASYTITLNDVPSAPTAGTPTNPTCTVPTGSVTLSNLPSSGTIYRIGSYANASYTITGGGTQTITGLLPGTYYFSASNGSCTSGTVSVIIVAPETNTWSTSGWSNGTPTINQRLVFSTDYTNVNDVDIVGCSCQVTGSTVVTIKSGRTLKIANEVDVASTASLIFENNASLVQINDAAVNTGNITYHRYTSAVKRYDFTYWSSPVEDQLLKNLSPNTLYDKYYSYNNGWQSINYGAASMTVGKGYIIRAPQTFSLTVATVDTNPTFIGTPNNGVKSVSVVGNQAQLLGNPYPSALDANAFLDANSSVLEGTLYFWTHNTPPSTSITGSASYKNYTVSDYAAYNRTGGVATAAALIGGAVPNGQIASGQGFFATAKATGNVVYNNSMRLNSSTGALLDNSQFFKLNTSKTTTTTTITEKNRIWLNLTNSEGAFKQTLVGYMTGATNNYEGNFDGLTYDGNQYLDFYSVNQAVKYTIQGRALPFVKQDTVTLGYKSAIVGQFEISIDHTDGVLSSQNVFLEDKDLKVLHDLKKGPYVFTTEKGVFNNRFVLRYVDKNIVEEVVETPSDTGNNGSEGSVNEGTSNFDVVVFVQNGEINVKSSVRTLKNVVVYDVAGKVLFRSKDINLSEFNVHQLLVANQVLIVEVLMADGTTVNRKIIY
ncbi:Ig-like domain-containing protein [Flavobacterium flavipallidum]|uniref:Ig-like domain-containing protein n=1 Tax=Flavobacterium flavipallidum TaxID=3139140 RepID=A0ABU9HLN9_9FLAO